MADSLNDHLRAELTTIQAEIERLESRRGLIQQLLGPEPAAPPPAPEPEPAAPRRRAARRTKTEDAPKRKRRPRGLITGKVREFLNQQTEPVHATEILAFLEKNDAAPQSEKPMPTLQSTLQRMKELGEIENTGRNRWALVSLGSGAAASVASAASSDDGDSDESAAEAPPPVAAPPVRSDGPPVVTSTTTFGTRPLGGQ